jgi:hypothetical protein
MTFEIEIDTSKGRFSMQVERTYAGESIEKFRVTYRDRSLLLQSNQPLLIATNSKKGIKWQLLEGEIRNPNIEEATMTLFRIQKAIEAYMKSSK